MPKRLGTIAKLIRHQQVANQTELMQLLETEGLVLTQSSVSRELKKLGVVKVDGFYRLPQVRPGSSAIIDRLDATCAGPNLIVLRTGPGNADRAAVLIDAAKISGLLGTIAGDDTVFLAVADAKSQAQVLRKIFSLFGHV